MSSKPDRDAAGASEHADEYIPGSDDSFALLYEREALRLTRAVYGVLGDRTEAEDCVQEAFLRAYRQWARWRPTAPARFWIQRIAINIALSRRRRQRIAAVKDRLLLGQATPEDAAPGWDLLRCLRRLPAKQSVVVLLRFNYGYNNRETGEILKISERGAGLRLQAALTHLRACLDDPVTTATTGPSE